MYKALVGVAAAADATGLGSGWVGGEEETGAGSRGSGFDMGPPLSASTGSCRSDEQSFALQAEMPIVWRRRSILRTRLRFGGFCRLKNYCIADYC